MFHEPVARPYLSSRFFASARDTVRTAIREARETDLSRRQASDLAWLVIGQLGSLLLSIVSIKLLTSMGTAPYGRYALALTVATLLSALLFGPAEQGFLRFYFPAANRGVSRTFVGIMYRSLLVAAVAFGLLACVAVAWQWRRAGFATALLVLAGGAFAIVSAATTPLAAMLNLLGYRQLNALLQVGERAVTVAMLWSLAHWGRLGVATALLAGTASVMLVAVLRSYSLSHVVPADRPMDAAARDASRRQVMRSVTTFGAPFAIWGLAGWLQSNSERWVIGAVLTTSGVGVYAMMLMVANVLVALPYGALVQLFTPAAYRRFQDPADSQQLAEGRRLIRFFVSSIVFLTVTAGCAALLLGRVMISLLSNPAFAAFWYLLPVVCVSTGLFYVGQALCLVGAALNVPRIYIGPKLLAGGLAVLLNGLAAWLFGLIGVAMAGWLIGGIYVLGVLRVNRRALKLAEAPVKAEWCEGSEG